MSKRYQKKSSTQKKRQKTSHGPTGSVGAGETTGVMGGMVSGFRRAVGSEVAKGQNKVGSLFWAALLVTGALAVLAWNFSR